ncbi:MAG: hypothetical protein ABEI31_10890 [Halodesulfurarchaeum sp.]
MARTLYVHLNREGMRTLEPETTEFSTDGSFQIILENHGQPAHVHLHFDDDLAAVASLEDPNWYVPAGEIEPVEVSVEDGSVGGGELDISTGYGAEGETISIEVDAPEEANGVSVDDGLSETGGAEESGRELPSVLLPGLFGALGVLATVVVMILVSDTAAVMLGGLAVLVAIAAAGYLLVGP